MEFTWKCYVLRKSAEASEIPVQEYDLHLSNLQKPTLFPFSYNGEGCTYTAYINVIMWKDKHMND